MFGFFEINYSIFFYKKIRFRCPIGENEFVTIEHADQFKYIATKDDINCILKCICIKNCEGVEITSSAFTEPIQPGRPQIIRIQLEGGPYYTKRFQLNVEYFGGDEGTSIIQVIFHNFKEFLCNFSGIKVLQKENMKLLKVTFEIY